MRTPELQLPVLSPLEGGLARLRHAMSEGSDRQRPRHRLALAAAMVLLTLISTPLVFRRLAESEFERRLDQAIRQLPVSDPVHAEGFVVSSDREFGNGVRVIELQPDRS